ncbi:MAG: PEP-CTERM sorting domain-containing protein [Planctomycetota bacterium]
MTYTITGLDLTSVGGTASETIVYDVLFTQTGGTAVDFNGFGNIAVTGGGGADAQVDTTETLTATLSLNSTTFTGDIDLGIVFMAAGGNGANDQWDVIHDGGTESLAGTGPGVNIATFAPSSFVTLDPTAGDGVNFQRFDVQVTAVPEPGSFALVGLGGLLVCARRRRG